jgi:ribonuclease R
LSHGIVDVLSGERRPLHLAELATRLNLRDRRELRDALDGLLADGVIVARAGQRYRLAPGMAARRQENVEGTVHVHPRGFAFVNADDGDVFVPPTALGGAMHGDRVLARVVAAGRRGREGAIVEVLERARRRVAGVLRGKGERLWLEPDDLRIRGPIELVARSEGDGALEPKAGLAAVVELTRYPEDEREVPQGALVALLGEPGDPDVEVHKVLLEHHIDERFPSEVEDEAAAYGDEPDAADLSHPAREDLRDLPFLAIDPTDARDHDDAVTARRLEDGGYEAWIAIADVSHYVRHHRALDREAKARGCSVYLPDRAVPMLPPTLSARLCSLLAGRDRLALALAVRLDASGAPQSARFVEASIRTKAFITYEAVARTLGLTALAAEDPNDERETAAREVRADLQLLWEVAGLLRARRMRRGALDLDLPEVRIRLDDKTRLPVSVSQRSADLGVKKAYRIVEELMLLANEQVARFLIESHIAAIFRIHAPPSDEKLERFAAQCKAMGVTFDAAHGQNPKQLSKFLKGVANHPRRDVIHGLMLRTLEQACYDTANIGHFGLASSAYLHFTSPIRRYPDLVVHRELRALLRRERPNETPEELQQASEMASKRERNAMEAERDVADIYRALYMRSRLGELFEATVVAIVATGIYVRIDEPFVDVLVPFDALGPGGWEADPLAVEVTSGDRGGGERIALGDRLHVTIDEVVVPRRLILGRRLVATREERRPPRERRRLRTTSSSRKEEPPRKGRSKQTRRSKPLKKLKEPKGRKRR